MKLVTRIAPTPNGYLHVGNALNAVLVWLWARQNDATILLRMDDLDTGRVRVEYIEEVFRTLEWLGIDWDIGPQTVDEFSSAWSQQHRVDEYNKAIQKLLDNTLAYHCRCSRVKWLNKGYDGCACKASNFSAGHDTTLRLMAMPDVLSFHDVWCGIQTSTFGNQSMLSAIRRRDGQPSYQISTVVDDVLFGVSHIIRGQDLVESTAFQRYLSELISMRQFCDIQFMHHPLVRVDGAKLSKSAGSTSLKHLRDSGASTDQFYLWVAKLLSAEPAANLMELLAQVNMDTIPFAEIQGW